MTVKPLHAWTLDPDEAVKIQSALRDRLDLTWDGREVATVGGVDVAIDHARARAAVVVFRFPDLLPLEGVTAAVPLGFPYMPGLLSFREGPAILAAWRLLRLKPDLLMFDGQGIAHPRGCGIASHLGLWLDRPSIGVAKTRLYGNHTAPGALRGAWTDLCDEDSPRRVIGAVVRTRADVKPVFVSPGHLIDVRRAVEFVLKCCSRYRLPETTRWAHRVAGGARFPPTKGRQARLF